MVTLRAQVTRAFNSSMEVYIEVTAEDVPAAKKIESNRAYFTFVAVDQSGRPIDVPELLPENDWEQKQFDGALRRRQMRLLLAGRIKPEDAPELKSLFVSPQM